jgi:two-component system cell cycle sensor histidine kinase/response regulator CckA
MSSPTRRVLLVDDEKSVRTMTQRMLEHHGFDVVAVSGGHEALDVFRQRDGAFGLVLLDWSMPGINGGETCRLLRQIRPGVPVVFMSGDSGSDVARRARQTGSRFLRKPFSRSALTETLSAVS